jgi:uncharacterized protein (TIGR03437 family)
MVQGVELYQPYGVALDLRGGPTHLYISDTRNARVLAWPDLNSYQIGDPPTLILGQPGPQYSIPMGIGAKGFASPLGMAVDPGNGNLYVADFGNNRVLRFPSPFDNPSRVEPDAVYGQPDFSGQAAASISASALNQPRAVAVDSGGNLWVADAGNNRVLRFSAAVLNSSNPQADTVIGQKDFSSGSANSGGAVSGAGFDTPSGLAFDAQGNLFVSDFRNGRVLKYSGPLGPSSSNPSAIAVWGQTGFSASGAPAQPSASSLAGPVGVAIDGAGDVYVAVPNDNRVLVFPPTSGSNATSVLGQSQFSINTPNTGAFPLASPNSLAGPEDVKVDRNGNIVVADTGNNRAIEYSAGSKSAIRVWGQSDFSSNGPNQIKPGSINFPYKIAIDYSASPFALYVSDSANNRVLVWKDSARFQSGDPADLVIGQPNLRTGAANVDTNGSANPSSTSLSAPAGIAVNQSDGTLYVADTGNNRVLRFPRPVNQGGRIAPDAVIGQADFTSSLSAALNASSLKAPGAVAIGSNGDLFVVDSGNNRVLEFAAGTGNGASAIRVYGQPNMNSAAKSSQPSAQTLTSPQGIAVDAASNMFGADSGANRVLVFPNTQNAPPYGAVAAFVIGTASFSSTAGILKTPLDVAVDSAGRIYVSDSGNNRVLVFPSLVFLPVAGGGATGVVGQSSVNGTAANWDGSNGLATPDSLYAPAGVYIDRQDTLFVGDAGNSRVLQFPKPAVVVNAATYQASVPIARGSLATLFGAGLTPSQATANGVWPTTALNRQLLFNDSIVAPLYYLDQGQIDFQAPSNAALGSDLVAVRTADTFELIAGGSVLIGAAAPGIFTANQSGGGLAAAVNQDGSINGLSNPASVGSIITLYGTGQGQVSPAVADGTPAPLSPPSNTVAAPTSDGNACQNTQPSVCVAFGSTGFGTIKYSGLAPGYVGLWQINVTVPPGTPSGSQPIRVLIDGEPSNVANVVIR